ncbi:Histone acetyltransferase HAC12 [Hirschfeldia incana]|nr:Histone acetyltransferase HAC12 [Hirschfeldia incana]
MDHDNLKLRLYMQNLVFNIVLQRQSSPVDAASKPKFVEVARRLEEGLYKMANSKEDYMNRSTLESRIFGLITRRYLSNYNQRNSSSVGTMIPTPGLPHAAGNASSMVTTSADATVSENNNSPSTAANTENLLAAGGMHEGNISNGYQHSSRNFSLGSGGNLTSLGSQRSTAQIIPSPGFVNDGTNNNSDGFSAETTMVPQSQQQQETGGQNSQMFSNQMSAGRDMQMQPKQDGVANNSVNDGVGVNEKGVDTGAGSRTTNPDTSGLGIRQIQKMSRPQDIGSDSNNCFGKLAVGVESEPNPRGQWPSQSRENTQISNGMSSEQNVQEDFSGRITGMDEAQPNNMTEGFVIGQNHNSTTSESHSLQNSTSHQQKWLLFLLHARDCKPAVGKCTERNCVTVRKLWSHMNSCAKPRCLYWRCRITKSLIIHFKTCKNLRCPLCVPVRKTYRQQQVNARHQARLENESSSVIAVKRDVVSNDSLCATAGAVSSAPGCVDTLDNMQASSKRLKMEPSFQPVVSETESCKSSTVSQTETELSQDDERMDHRHSDAHAVLKSENVEVNEEISDISVQDGFGIKEIKHEAFENDPKPRPVSEPGQHDISGASPKQDTIQMEQESKKEVLVESADVVASKSGNPKIKGVSLTEFFTPEQVREHIRGLRQWIGQNKGMENSMSENTCQLCAVEQLTFEPPPIYCTPCGARIKRNAMYYTVVAAEHRHYFCIPCYNGSRGDTILAEGTSMPKARLEKKTNNQEAEEWWVQCDKCEAWQHQICALFNGRRNDGGQAEYTCPNCYILEVEHNERKPLLQSVFLGAKDLPKTILSDHIEQRLFQRLEQERTERARAQGKTSDEIPTAESLAVRVVLSVDKKLEVKSRFLEIFREDNFPTEFPYKSKVVLLFQKIEGVEVCLFGVYVQEFGSECSSPNHRRVYLSYLDSVKYFRPEIKCAYGEALRTFVYQEILIGYLEHCKMRGFTSCYIWACPPLKGDDYILYCHPEIQKTPKSDKLRGWYLAMLRKAAKEGIVAGTTNLYDHFFLQIGECRAKVTAARLPYFDGDYWPGAAEDIIHQMGQEDDGRKGNKKGVLKKPVTKRALKGSGQSNLSRTMSIDQLLMHKLGETIRPMKEDFIMVHLQPCCTHCCTLMVTGNRWVCSQCKGFQLCDRCYEAELKRGVIERHPVNQKVKHTLYHVEITDIPADTTDRDEILESEFFDTRQAFLSLCQGNHYQYDTLRRAKHSSMMVLYHLHNPTAPAFVATCNACHLDIESGQGWRCDVCPDYDVCNTCYSRDGCVNHPHKLTNHPSLADQNAQNKEARQLRDLRLRRMRNLLVHGVRCRTGADCQYPNCRVVSGLFEHALHCTIQCRGGCVQCKKMWHLLQIHSRDCNDSNCGVLRCGEIKENQRRLQQRSESRRRAAVMEMVRQRAAEVAGTSG